MQKRVVMNKRAKIKKAAAIGGTAERHCKKRQSARLRPKKLLRGNDSRRWSDKEWPRNARLQKKLLPRRRLLQRAFQRSTKGDWRA